MLSSKKFFKTSGPAQLETSYDAVLAMNNKGAAQTK